MRRSCRTPALLLGLLLLAACGQARGAATQQGQGQGQGQSAGECNKGNKPGDVVAVKPLIVDDSSIDVSAH
jgi:hypothetical protein